MQVPSATGRRHDPARKPMGAQMKYDFGHTDILGIFLLIYRANYRKSRPSLAHEIFPTLSEA